MDCLRGPIFQTFFTPKGFLPILNTSKKSVHQLVVIAPGKIPSQHINVSLFSLNCYWTELYEEFIACKYVNRRNSLIWHTTKILCQQQEIRFDGIVTFESLRSLLLSVSETVLSTYNLVMSLCTCTKQLCQVTHFFFSFICITCTCDD